MEAHTFSTDSHSSHGKETDGFLEIIKPKGANNHSPKLLLLQEVFLDHPSYRDLSPFLITYEINNGQPSLVLMFIVLVMPI